MKAQKRAVKVAAIIAGSWWVTFTTYVIFFY